MVWPWEVFEEKLTIKQQDQMEDLSIGKITLEVIETGETFECFVLCDLYETDRNEVAALVYVLKTKQLRVITRMCNGT
jgi:hypothetical protein